MVFPRHSLILCTPGMKQCLDHLQKWKYPQIYYLNVSVDTFDHVDVGKCPDEDCKWKYKFWTFCLLRCYVPKHPWYNVTSFSTCPLTGIHFSKVIPHQTLLHVYQCLFRIVLSLSNLSLTQRFQLFQSRLASLMLSVFIVNGDFKVTRIRRHVMLMLSFFDLSLLFMN